jgi:4'-phosphopantetheinyl transferase
MGMELAVGENDLWVSPPECLTLAAEEVHVWRVGLDQKPSTVQALLRSLSPDECERAGKYHFHRHFEHFVVARAALRDIISRYVALSPREIQFLYDQYGKPRLSPCGTPLCFNLSHSKGIALCAISQAQTIGVDVEYARENFSVEEIAERFFSANEVASLRALPSDLRIVGFFNCWTRKEAYIKALGEGLSHPLDRFTVSIAPGQPLRLLMADDPAELSRWTLVEILVGSGYIASLAVEGKVRTLRHWKWDDHTGIDHSQAPAAARI